jgi:hypothetical protein
MPVEQLLGLAIRLVADGWVEGVKRFFQEVGWISTPPKQTSQSIDDRIAKIDEARSNLVEVLNAIDELRSAAEQNQRDAEIALRQLEKLEQDKASLEKELESVRGIIDVDVTTFRQIAGIPSTDDIRRERVLGFITGVLASVVASGIVWLLVQGARLVIGFG